MLTWRELIANIQAKAAEHGDHVLNLPVHVGLSSDEHVADGITYNEHQPATEEDAAEEEQLILTTNWD